MRQGIFQFRHPDAIGLPVYEFFMWGFYVLHAVGFLTVLQARPTACRWALGLAIVFALCFLMMADPVPFGGSGSRGSGREPDLFPRSRWTVPSSSIWPP